MQGRHNRANPAARSEGVLTEMVGREAVIYDSETAEAHCLKPLAASVFTHCDGTRSVAQISQLVSRDLSKDVDVEDVEDALAQLREHGLLQEDPETLSVTISRRQMLRRTAGVGGAAMGATLIASVATPIPAFATATCTASTNSVAVSCNSPSDCSGGSPFSGVGTCSCKQFSAPCPQPAAGFTGICFFHSPDSSGGHCTPDCADGTPPCKS